VFKRLVYATLSASALAAVLPITARAADPATCQDYAKVAIKQVTRELAKPACANPPQVWTRWSTNYWVHYDWCIAQPMSEPPLPPGAFEGGGVAHERAARASFLKSCRG
jgi:hypothetical protein